MGLSVVFARVQGCKRLLGLCKVYLGGCADLEGFVYRGFVRVLMICSKVLGVQALFRMLPESMFILPWLLLRFLKLMLRMNMSFTKTKAGAE